MSAAVVGGHNTIDGLPVTAYISSATREEEASKFNFTNGDDDGGSSPLENAGYGLYGLLWCAFWRPCY